jgi:hypothetical protein
MDAVTQVQQVATTASMEAWSFILSFLALIVITAALFAWSLRSGKRGIVALTLSLYAGYALYAVFPYADQVLAAGKDSALALFITKVVLFLALSAIPFYLLLRTVAADWMPGNKLVLLVACALTGAFIIALGYHTLGAKAAYAFTPSIDALFAPAKYFFWWFIAPLAGVFLLVR